MKLAIISTHPIQYNAPWFRLLAEGNKMQVFVFYTWGPAGQGAKYDPDFKKKIEWDIPLLEGYEYKFVENTAKDPGTHHFKGVINPGLIGEIEAWRPDAVLVFGWSFHSHLACLRHFHGKLPVLFRGDSTLLDERPGIRRWIRRESLRWIYRHVDYAFYVGSDNREYFLRHGLKVNQLVFIPHAVDNDRFAEPEALYAEKAKAWREKLGITENEFVLLFAGKLEPKKNPFFLLRLAKGIPDSRLRVLIVGSGVLEAGLKRAAGNDSRILFLEFQNQQIMPVIYRLGSVFVLPSTGPGETWGLAVNEAMASGRPVMVSAMAGCAVDLVPDNRNGFRFDPDDLEGCIDFISQVLADRDRLAMMDEYSRTAVSEYSFKNIVNGITGFLEQLEIHASRINL